MEKEEPRNFGSYSHLDPNMGIFKEDSSTLANTAFFTKIWLISKEVSIKYRSHPNAKSGYGLRIHLGGLTDRVRLNVPPNTL